MKKVGILTVHRLPNWGSALQGYALQKVVESLGFECECINYKYPNSWHIKKGSWIQARPGIKRKIGVLLGMRAPFLLSMVESFVKKEIKESKEYNSFEDIHSDPPIYDIYISGSDQIWNWKSMCADSTYLLDFAPDDRLKISYSSSFSVSYIPENLKKMYVNNLLRYKSLSVRESNGCKIIKQLLGKNIPIVLDPTLLINKTQWSFLAKKAKWKCELPSKFILSYLLDYTFDPRPAMTLLLYKLQEIYKCPVIMIGRNNDIFKGDKFKMPISQGIGVYEFLWLVEHATVVASSSFHGTAFAINMGTPFISLIEKEEQEDDRIKSLLASVGLTENLVTTTSNFHNMKIDGTYDVDCVESKLDSLREKSIKYLQKNLYC